MAFYLGLCRLRGILSPPAPHDGAAGRLFFVVATTAAGGTILLCGSEEWNWTQTSLPLRPLQAELFSAALIPKFDPEIKNRCTQKVLNREKLATIPKSGLEIKNRCIGGVVAFCRRNHSPSRQRSFDSDADLVAATTAAGGTILLRSNENQNRTRTSLPLRL